MSTDDKLTLIMGCVVAITAMVGAILGSVAVWLWAIRGILLDILIELRKRG